MLLVVTLAAAESPWECPALTTPAEASVWRGADLGAAEMLDAVEATVTAISSECAWVVTTGEVWGGGWTESVCDTAQLHVVWLESVAQSDGVGASTTVRTTTFDATWTGGGWTSLHSSEVAEAQSGLTGSWVVGAVTREASWVGSIDGLPDDASLTRREEHDEQSGGSRDDIAVETATCTFAWSREHHPNVLREEVTTTPGVQVVVETTPAGSGCAEGYVHAAVDGVDRGAVDPETWEPAPDDADRDGLVVACDCDDTNASVNVFAEEIPGDGIDQDCDGEDPTDGEDTASDRATAIGAPSTCSAAPGPLAILGLLLPLLRRRAR